MNSPAEWLVVALLAAWFGVSMAYQLFLRRLMSVLARWDVFRVVPSWHLYSAIPKARRLYFRDRDAVGRTGDWQEIRLPRSRRAARALFNPDLFAADAVLSLMEFLCEAVKQVPPAPERLVNSVGWRGVWLCAAAQPRAVEVIARQFEVREQALTLGAQEERVYASEFLAMPDLGGGA